VIRRLAVLPVVLALFAAPALSAETPAGVQRLTLLVTGDNRGEIAPCG